MSIEINGKIYRNLQEQVQKNMEDIDEIDSALALKSDKSDTYTKTEVDEKIESLGQLHPSGTDTSTNILAFTEDKGIYIGIDTGEWYYWNGTQYVSGGTYMVTEPNYSFELGTINANGTNNDDEPYNHIRCRTVDYVYLKKGQMIKFNKVFKYDYNIMEFDLNKNIISDDGWTSNAYWVAYQDMYIRLVLKLSDAYLNLINRAIGYYHKNDRYELKDNRIVFDLKDINVGDTITIKDRTGERFALSVLDKPYGYVDITYLYDSDWVSSGTTLTHTIESGAKCVLLVRSKNDNSNFITKGDMLYPNIIIRKANDDYISLNDILELNAQGFYLDKDNRLNIEKNTINNNMIQWAHRGYNEYAPENTIPSFEMAYKFGLRCMECDVRLTADNVPVILHDSTINRTARKLDGSTIGTSIDVSSLNLPTLLNNYDFGIYFSDEYAGTKIPTFEELIIWCKSKNCYLHIDLLGGAIDTTTKLEILYNIVKSYGMQNNVLWEVKNTSLITWLQAKDANTEIIFNPSDILTTADIDTIVSYGLKKISTRVDTKYNVIQYANQKGLQVFLWSANPVSVSNDNIVKYYKYGASGFYTSLQTVDVYLKDYLEMLSKVKDVI